MINLKISTGKMKVRDLLEIEQGNKSIVFMVGLLSRFVVDDAGEYLQPEQAREALADLTVDELGEVVEKFAATVRATQESAVNPQTADA